MPILTDPSYRKHPRSGNWEVNYYVIDGARKHRRWKGGFARKYDAEQWFFAYRAQVEKGEIKLSPETGKPLLAPRGGNTVGSFIAEYLQTVAHRRREGTNALEEGILTTFRDFVGADTPLTEITTAHIETYLAARRHRRFPVPTRQISKKQLSPRTINRELGAIREAFLAAVRWKLIDCDPTDEVDRLRVPEGEVRYLSLDDQAKLVAASWKISNPERETRSSADAPYLYPLIVLALRTGMRRGELFNLRWKAVDLEGQRVTVANSEDWLTKSGRFRVVGLHQDAIQALTWWKEWFRREIKRAESRSQDPKVHAQLRTKAKLRLDMLKLCEPRADRLVFPSFRRFDSETGEAAPMDNIDRSFEAALKLAFGDPIPRAYQDFSLHDLRHTFAVTCARAGIPLAVLSKQLGHQDMATTQIYLRFYPDEGSAQVAALLPAISCGSAVGGVEDQKEK